MQTFVVARLSPEKPETTSNANKKTPESCCPVNPSHQHSLPKHKTPLVMQKVQAKSPQGTQKVATASISIRNYSLSTALPFFFRSVPSIVRPPLSSCIASSSLSSSTENRSQLGLLHTCSFPDSVLLPALRPGRMGAGCGLAGCLRLSVRWLWR